MSRSPLTLHAGPGVGFDEPFEMLEACHERVQRMLALLERIALHVPVHGADAQAADAARDVMRYFDIAGPHHHEDEERHVLPRLAALGEAALAGRLHADHLAMSSAWSTVRADLQAIGHGRVPAAFDSDVVPRWRAYASLYAAHIEAEEAVAYPAVRRTLAPDAMPAIGQEMAARRGAASRFPGGSG